MKNDYIVRAKYFVQQFFPYLERFKDLQIAISYFNKDHHRKVIYASGATRCVLITSDYCIKIDKKEGRSYWGNCESEYNACLKMQKRECSNFFVPITKFSYKGKEFYIVPRCTGINKHDLWDVFNQLPVKERKFIRENFEDLHSGNIGRLHKKIVIIDYAANYL